MNILIKLMSIVSLVVAPTLAQIHGTRSDRDEDSSKTIKSIKKETTTTAATANYSQGLNP